MRTDYLIIGNSAGGIGAVEAIRLIDSEGAITIISDEPYPVYSRPLISEHLAGERDLVGMLYRSDDFYTVNKVQTIFGKEVVRIDIAAGEVELADTEKISCQKLLLSTGGNPIFPPTDGSDKKGVFSFTTLDNAKGIAEMVNEGSRKAVVIGGGLIGISVTDALKKLGVNVIIVELMGRILSAVLDEEASRMAREVVEAADVEFRTGHTVKTIVGDDGIVSGVILDDGEEIECDLVIVAIGVVPRIDLVKDTDIKVNRGILVDRHMATSNPDVYACGDVAESYDFIYEDDRVVPVWPNAHIGGRIAGFNMAGREAEYLGGTAMNSLKYFGLSIASAGMVNPMRDIECEVLSQRDDGRYQKFVLQNGKLVGIVLVRDIEKAGIYFGLMRDGVDVSNFKDSLLSEEFGIISLPEDVLRKRLELLDLSKLSSVMVREEIEVVVDEG